MPFTKRSSSSSTRARFVGVAVGVLIALAPAGWAGARTTIDGAAPATTVAPTSTFVYDLEKEPSECIGFLPKPGCGKEPEQAGDRGGALQWTTFGVILLGVGVIGTVVVRNVIRRDRAIAEDLRAKGL